MRNFTCPETEQPCENDRCTRTTCTEQVKAVERAKVHNAPQAMRQLAAKDLWELLYPEKAGTLPPPGWPDNASQTN